MADDPKQRGGSDRRRIDIHQDYELRDWSKKFGVTADELVEAVRAVGDDASAVEKHLSGRKPASRSGDRPR